MFKFSLPKGSAGNNQTRVFYDTVSGKSFTEIGRRSHHTRLVAAAAAARSGFPLAARPDALGNADPPLGAGPGALETCLAAFGSVLGICERRLDAPPFTGELPALATLDFKVTGGGGSGSGRAEDMEPEALRLGPGEPVAVTGGLGRGFILTPVMN